MSYLDWTVMCGTILLIVGYGMWKSRNVRDIKGFLLADNDMKWWTIGLSIMATQASAITFLSTPGQAFDDGMRFVQFYLGVPIAMVVIAVVAIPIYRRLNVYTAYEYLEGRFDLKTRTLAAILFLIQRGLAAGMTIYAPAIILVALLGWDINLTCIGIGMVVMLYTVSGGTKAVSETQQQQMAIILIGMVLAGVLMVMGLPEDISFGNAMTIAGSMGKLNAITFPESSSEFFKDRFNLFTGLIAGTFLALSYFGTDQSQVQRYLGGKSVTESRLGLMFNGIFKVPMQFLILFIGVMMFVFYQFQPTPLLFNEKTVSDIQQSTVQIYRDSSEEQFVTLNSENRDKFAAAQPLLAGAHYDSLALAYDAIHKQKAASIRQFLAVEDEVEKERLKLEVQSLQQQGRAMRKEAKATIKAADPEADVNDLDRVFLTFVLNHLPIGLIGLLMAVILSAAMSSTAAELNALATTTVVDIYKRSIKSTGSPTHDLRASRLVTMFWGILAIIFSLVASDLGNLIQAVNLLGSLFYGTILGIFVVAFFFKKIQGNAIFFAALIGEAMVIAIYVLPQISDAFAWLDIGFLWYNLIGCFIVVVISILLQRILPTKNS